MYVCLVAGGTLVYDNIIYIYIYPYITFIQVYLLLRIVYYYKFYSRVEKIKLVKQNEFVFQKCR